MRDVNTGFIRQPREEALSYGRGLLVGLAVCCAISQMTLAQGDAPQATSSLPITDTDRIMVLAPHPDDEVIACGGIIQKAIGTGAQVRVVFLTYGDNNEWSFLVYRKHPVLTPKGTLAMGEVRHDEAIAADSCLGLSSNQLVFLGYPDFRTLDIWREHWGGREPCRSMLTRTTAVPYKDAFRPGALHKGEEIVRDLVAVMSEFKPTKIFVSHPADHNPDHLALYLFTTVALWNLQGKIHPHVFPYIVHFRNWPYPRKFIADATLSPPRSMEDDIAWTSSVLPDSAVETKGKAMRLHKSQFVYSANYLLSFVRRNELFGNYLPLIGKSREEWPRKEASEQDSISEELTEEERARFVGIEARSMKVGDGKLAVTVTFSRPFGHAVSFSLYAFGYRRDVPFEKMPKLHMRFTAIGHELLDQDRKLALDLVQVRRTSHEISVGLPLDLLGNPVKILTGANTYLAELPLDWAPLRIFDFEPDGK